MAIIHTTQGQRASQVYKEFLLRVQAACGAQGKAWLCWSHRQNKMDRHEARGTNNTYALRCLLKPKTYTTNGHEPQVSGVPICTIPLDLTAAEISRDAVEEGHG